MLKEQQFLTKKKADEFRQKLIISFMKKDCPVFKKTCHGCMCHSFFEGSIRQIEKNDKKTFKVYEPFCSSPLITGTIEHETL